MLFLSNEKGNEAGGMDSEFREARKICCFFCVDLWKMRRGEERRCH